MVCAALSVLGACVSPVAAQTGSKSAVATGNSARIDRRFAIAKGSWSAAAVSLFNTWTALDDNPGRHMFCSSPDGKKRIEVVGTDVYLWIGQRKFDAEIDSVTKHDAELSWSPDSTKYFVTWTETGELGAWHMQVYGVDESGVHEFPSVEDPAREDFEHRVRQMPIDPELNNASSRYLWQEEEYCEPYSVVGGRWLNGSKEILLSVLIPNTGQCRYMSEFNVYRVNSTTGEILQRYTAVEAHKQFGDKYLPLITR
jgi:hypothetical protein